MTKERLAELLLSVKQPCCSLVKYHNGYLFCYKSQLDTYVFTVEYKSMSVLWFSDSASESTKEALINLIKQLPEDAIESLRWFVVSSLFGEE